MVPASLGAPGIIMIQPDGMAFQAVEHEQAGTGSYHTRYLVPIARNHDDPGDLARSRSRYPGYPPADTLTFITT